MLETKKILVYWTMLKNQYNNQIEGDNVLTLHFIVLDVTQSIHNFLVEN